MKTGRYSLKELLTHNEIEQIIIPEIQRDYVWQEKNVQKLLSSIIEHFESKTKKLITIEVNGSKLKASHIEAHLQKEYDRLINNVKLGFIYAYHDNQYSGKFFLIDGQQRFTTLYLLLLAVYVKNNDSKKFKEQYFKDGLLKIDYKVRESAHDFMVSFVENELLNSDFEITESEYYYKNEYAKDETIINLLQNYNLIQKILEENITRLKFDDSLQSFIEYVEDFIEVNYFDTNLSEQGEQLYLYMNSRGESLSYQEILKSEIIRKVDSLVKKKEIGQLWEDWQNFFWVNRGDDPNTKNENADIGFEEFLKWSTIIHICTSENSNIELAFLEDKKRNQTITESKENYIKIFDYTETKKKEIQLDSLIKYQIKYINSDFLEKNINSIKYLCEIKSEFVPINSSWLHNTSSVIDYVIILPLIYYVSNSEWENEHVKKRDVERLAMFLKNVTYFENVSKNPDNYTIQSIELVKLLCDDGEKDILNFLSNKFDKKYQTILTDAERNKLQFLKDAGEMRNSIEDIIWNITLNNRLSIFLRGDISILLHTIKQCEREASETKIDLVLNTYYLIFNDLILKYKLDNSIDDADTLRRALLTFDDDYLFETSGSNKFGTRIDGYSFGYYYNRDNKEWLDILKNKANIVAKFLFSLKSRKLSDLTVFIDDYDKKDWKEAVIKIPNVLRYCLKKRILWQNENRILLISEKEKGYVELQCFLLKEFLEKEKLYFSDFNVCTYNFIKAQKEFTLNIKYSTRDWSVSVKSEDLDSTKFLYDSLNKTEWKFETENKLIQKNQIIYSDDPTKSIIENVKQVKLIVQEIIDSNSF